MEIKKAKAVLLATLLLTGLGSASESLEWSNSTDWDNSLSESNVVHGSWGEHSSEKLELGWPRYGKEGSLTGYWTFDEDTGSVAEDVSGSSNDGSIESGINKGDEGVFGTSSFYFNSGEVTVSSPVNELPTGDTAFTTVYWFRGDGANDNGGLVHWGSNSGSQGSGQEVRDGGWQHYFYSNDLNCYKIGMQNGNWHMITVTFNPSTDSRKMYMDGNQECSDDPGTVDISDTKIRIGNGDASSQLSNAQIDELRIYRRALSSSEIQNLYDATSKGKITTDWKNFTSERDPSTLKLENVTSSLNGQSIEVKVESDNDNDGTVEETSTPISLNGTGGPYDLEGLSSRSKKYRLEINLSSSQVTTTPELSSLSLNTTGPTVCDSRGPERECISEDTHDIDGQKIDLNSRFEAKESATFEAFTNQAQLSITNSSIFSGLWTGTFNLTADQIMIKPGAEFRPSNGRIILREN